MPSLLQRLAGLVRRPSDDDGDPVFPPLLPSPSKGYALFISGNGYYDIRDGGEIVGWLHKRVGNGQRPKTWSLTVKRVSYNFPSLEAAKAWLGNPPVLSYR